MSVVQLLEKENKNLKEKKKNYGVLVIGGSWKIMKFSLWNGFVLGMVLF